MRPTLRPGCHVLRRNDHELQVGLDPTQAVVLPDNPEVRRCLELLRDFADECEYDGSATLDLLRDAGLVLDGNVLMPLLPQTGTAPATSRDRPFSRSAVAALARATGDRAADLLTSRRRARIGIVPFDQGSQGVGAEAGDGLADRLRRHVRHSGVRVTASGAHDAVLSVGVGEPEREVLDAWMHAGTPHLLVRLTEGFATLGPFVAPGETACLRCIDAHHTDADPSWPLLVAQYADLTRRPRADGVPEPVDDLLAEVALAWAARDVASYLDGRRPATWSMTVRLDPHLTSIETRFWLRHPECGCGWR